MALVFEQLTFLLERELPFPAPAPHRILDLVLHLLICAKMSRDCPCKQPWFGMRCEYSKGARKPCGKASAAHDRYMYKAPKTVLRAFWGHWSKWVGKWFIKKPVSGW